MAQPSVFSQGGLDPDGVRRQSLMLMGNYWLQFAHSQLALVKQGAINAEYCFQEAQRHVPNDFTRNHHSTNAQYEVASGREPNEQDGIFEMASSSACIGRQSEPALTGGSNDGNIETTSARSPSLSFVSAGPYQPEFKTEQPHTQYPKPDLQEHPMNRRYELNSCIFGSIPSVAISRPFTEPLLHPSQLLDPITMDPTATLAPSRNRQRKETDTDSDTGITPTAANPGPSSKRALPYRPKAADTRSSTPLSEHPCASHDNNRTTFVSELDKQRAAARNVWEEASGAEKHIDGLIQKNSTGVDVDTLKGLEMMRRGLFLDKAHQTESEKERREKAQRDRELQQARLNAAWVDTRTQKEIEEEAEAGLTEEQVAARRELLARHADWDGDRGNWHW